MTRDCRSRLRRRYRLGRQAVETETDCASRSSAHAVRMRPSIAGPVVLYPLPYGSDYTGKWVKPQAHLPPVEEPPVSIAQGLFRASLILVVGA